MSNPNADEISWRALNAVKSNPIGPIAALIAFPTKVIPPDSFSEAVVANFAAVPCFFKASVYFAETTWAFLRVLLSSF